MCTLCVFNTDVFFFQDAIALLRLDDLYIDSFEVDDGTYLPYLAMAELHSLLVQWKLFTAITCPARLVALQAKTEKLNLRSRTQLARVLYSLTSMTRANSDAHRPVLTPICYFRKIHILGSFTNIKVARDAVVDLILGTWLPYLVMSLLT